jgi:hypothetical protein
MVTSEAVSRVQISAAYEPSQAVVDCIEALEGERDSLFRTQRRFGVDAPLDVDLRLAGRSKPHDFCTRLLICDSLSLVHTCAIVGTQQEGMCQVRFPDRGSFKVSCRPLTAQPIVFQKMCLCINLLLFERDIYITTLCFSSGE